jgi:hypothetical protein
MGLAGEEKGLGDLANPDSRGVSAHGHYEMEKVFQFSSIFIKSYSI